MAEVPRIVRERLRNQAAGGEHPDANLLSAFAEHSLDDGERVQVLEHLSRCAECREVLALAQPEDVPLQAGTALVVTRSWWRSPVVHWSALITAGVVVLIAVAMHPHRQRQGYSASAPGAPSVDSIAASPPAAARADKPVSSPTPAPEKKSPTRRAEVRMDEESRADKKKAQAKVKEPVSPAASGQSRDKLTMFASGAAVNAPAPPPPPVPSAQPIQLQDFSAGSQDSAAVGQVQSQAASTPAVTGGNAKSQGTPYDSLGPVTGAAPAPKNETATFNKNAGRSLALRASLSPRWSISDAGALQRSLDGGRSWIAVPVANGVTFLTLATAGNDVWAGGNGGVLYHSSDTGESWTRVRVESGGRFLTGNIVRIEFANSNDGVLRTSTGETWTTSDGGVAWQRR